MEERKNICGQGRKKEYKEMKGLKEEKYWNRMIKLKK